MTPLDHLINYSSELAQRPSFLAKNVASRVVTAFAIPFELLAVLENAIKLPFQAAASIVKIPAKIVNVFADSMSLKEFESRLASPLDVIATAFKIVGFAMGFLFTATLGLLSPHKNFSLHCSLGLVSNHHAQRLVRLEKEKRQKEIEAHEKIIEDRLKAILDTMRQQQPQVVTLSPEQRNEIESITKVPCPSIDEVVIPSSLQDLNEMEDTHVDEVLSNNEPLEIIQTHETEVSEIVENIEDQNQQLIDISEHEEETEEEIDHDEPPFNYAFENADIECVNEL